MKGLIALLALTLMTTAAAESADSKLERGQAVYEASAPKCKTCHSVGGVGNPKGALEGAASKLKPEEVAAWLRTPKTMSEKTNATRRPLMPTYGPDKVSDADLEALIAYLMSLR
jgi:mono/diheme cytochrome c family protein